MYTRKNFKTKKELRQAVDAWNDYCKMEPRDGMPGTPAVTYFQPGPFGGNEPRDGTIYVEGPQYPAPHRFYAQCTAKDGVIVKVK